MNKQPWINPNWQPTASIQNLKRRAKLMADIRQFFAKRAVMEVDTQLLSQGSISDPYIEVMQTTYTGPLAPEGKSLYLQTSPEFAMKRLLTAGSGCIYQLGKVFRDGEAGPRHNSEFTMLEWYRVGFSLEALMDEMVELLQDVSGESLQIERISYRDAFVRALQIDPFIATLSELQQAAQQYTGYGKDERDRDTLLNLLISHCVEPTLGKNGSVSLLFDYPASQAALAKVAVDAQNQPVAKRFEVFIDGIELANGYHELTDPKEQAKRIEADKTLRSQLGVPVNQPDTRLVDALEAGMPECSGVALGIDRLLMHLCKAKHINEVIAFPLFIA